MRPMSVKGHPRLGAWIAATLALAGAVLVASIIPAVGATRVDPVVAMRVEQ